MLPGPPQAKVSGNAQVSCARVELKDDVHVLRIWGGCHCMKWSISIYPTNTLLYTFAHLQITANSSYSINAA